MGVFQVLLNFTNGTKSRNASPVLSKVVSNDSTNKDMITLMECYRIYITNSGEASAHNTL